jgi:hypothetical protein
MASQEAELGWGDEFVGWKQWEALARDGKAELLDLLAPRGAGFLCACFKVAAGPGSDAVTVRMVSSLDPSTCSLWKGVGLDSLAPPELPGADVELPRSSRRSLPPNCRALFNELDVMRQARAVYEEALSIVLASLVPGQRAKLGDWAKDDAAFFLAVADAVSLLTSGRLADDTPPVSAVGPKPLEEWSLCDLAGMARRDAAVAREVLEEESVAASRVRFEESVTEGASLPGAESVLGRDLSPKVLLRCATWVPLSLLVFEHSHAGFCPVVLRDGSTVSSGDRPAMPCLHPGVSAASVKAWESSPQALACPPGTIPNGVMLGVSGGTGILLARVALTAENRVWIPPPAHGEHGERETGLAEFERRTVSRAHQRSGIYRMSLEEGDWTLTSPPPRPVAVIWSVLEALDRGAAASLEEGARHAYDWLVASSTWMKPLQSVVLPRPSSLAKPCLLGLASTEGWLVSRWGEEASDHHTLLVQSMEVRVHPVVEPEEGGVDEDGLAKDMAMGVAALVNLGAPADPLPTLRLSHQMTFGVSCGRDGVGPVLAVADSRVWTVPLGRAGEALATSPVGRWEAMTHLPSGSIVAANLADGEVRVVGARWPVCRLKSLPSSSHLGGCVEGSRVRFQSAVGRDVVEHVWDIGTGEMLEVLARPRRGRVSLGWVPNPRGGWGMWDERGVRGTKGCWRPVPQAMTAARSLAGGRTGLDRKFSLAAALRSSAHAQAMWEKSPPLPLESFFGVSSLLTHDRRTGLPAGVEPVSELAGAVQLAAVATCEAIAAALDADTSQTLKDLRSSALSAVTVDAEALRVVFATFDEMSALQPSKAPRPLEVEDWLDPERDTTSHVLPESVSSEPAGLHLMTQSPHAFASLAPHLTAPGGFPMALARMAALLRSGRGLIEPLVSAPGSLTVEASRGAQEIMGVVRQVLSVTGQPASSVWAVVGKGERVSSQARVLFNGFLSTLTSKEMDEVQRRECTRGWGPLLQDVVRLAVRTLDGHGPDWLKDAAVRREETESKAVPAQLDPPTTFQQQRTRVAAILSWLTPELVRSLPTIEQYVELLHSSAGPCSTSPGIDRAKVDPHELSFVLLRALSSAVLEDNAPERTGDRELDAQLFPGNVPLSRFRALVYPGVLACSIGVDPTHAAARCVADLLLSDVEHSVGVSWKQASGDSSKWVCQLDLDKCEPLFWTGRDDPTELWEIPRSQRQCQRALEEACDVLSRSVGRRAARACQDVLQLVSRAVETDDPAARVRSKRPSTDDRLSVHSRVAHARRLLQEATRVAATLPREDAAAADALMSVDSEPFPVLDLLVLLYKELEPLKIEPFAAAVDMATPEHCRAGRVRPRVESTAAVGSPGLPEWALNPITASNDLSDFLCIDDGDEWARAAFGFRQGVLERALRLVADPVGRRSEHHLPVCANLVRRLGKPSLSVAILTAARHPGAQATAGQLWLQERERHKREARLAAGTLGRDEHEEAFSRSGLLSGDDATEDVLRDAVRRWSGHDPSVGRVQAALRGWAERAEAFPPLPCTAPSLGKEKHRALWGGAAHAESVEFSCGLSASVGLLRAAPVVEAATHGEALEDDSLMERMGRLFGIGTPKAVHPAVAAASSAAVTTSLDSLVKEWRILDASGERLVDGWASLSVERTQWAPTDFRLLSVSYALARGALLEGQRLSPDLPASMGLGVLVRAIQLDAAGEDAPLLARRLGRHVAVLCAARETAETHLPTAPTLASVINASHRLVALDSLPERIRFPLLAEASSRSVPARQALQALEAHTRLAAKFARHEVQAVLDEMEEASVVQRERLLPREEAAALAERLWGEAGSDEEVTGSVAQVLRRAAERLQALNRAVSVMFKN